MKVTNIFTLIEEFRNGRDLWSRNHVELAVREIRRCHKRIAELEEQQRWIPVSERLPRAGEKVLVVTRLGDAQFHILEDFFAEQFRRNFRCWIPNPPESEG